MDLTKKRRSLEMNIPLKCNEFVPHTVDFADGNDRAGPLLRLYDKFL